MPVRDVAGYLCQGFFGAFEVGEGGKSCCREACGSVLGGEFLWGVMGAFPLK